MSPLRFPWSKPPRDVVGEEAAAYQPERLPTLLGIGAMRSGTTWLHRQLANHPAIWMASPKELHFFDRRMSNSFSKPCPQARAAYAALFADAPRNAVHRGEITPAYATLPAEMVDAIRAWMPDLKILFLMRDPVLRAWSQIRKDYGVHWNLGKPLDEATADELAPFIASPDIAGRSRYADTLDLWMARFPRDQFHFAFMEDIADHPLVVLDGLYRFLGLDPVPGGPNPGAAVNARPNVPIPEGVRRHMEEIFYPDNARLAALIGRPLPWAGNAS